MYVAADRIGVIVFTCPDLDLPRHFPFDTGVHFTCHLVKIGK